MNIRNCYFFVVFLLSIWLLSSCASNQKVLYIPSEKQSPEMLKTLWESAINKSVRLGYIINREKEWPDSERKEIDLYRIYSGETYYINVRQSKEGISVSGHVKGQLMNLIVGSDVEDIYRAVKKAGNILPMKNISDDECVIETKSNRKGGRARLSEKSEICGK